LSDHGEPFYIDTSRPHPARMYDYYLGGKDNFPADREAAERAISSFPRLPLTANENRSFMARAVRFAARSGVRQFLDIGVGIPARHNTVEVAQAVAPESRVVYVDNDPIVLAHSRALTVSDPAGVTAYIERDLREPAAIITDAGATLDFTKPVAVLLVAMLHFFEDDENPRAIVETLLDALAPGSYLIASHLAREGGPKGVDGVVDTYRRNGMRMQARFRDEFTTLAFGGLRLVDPGVVALPAWRPDDPAEPRPDIVEVAGWGGVAVKD
jgi:SAM-dependent methyltransferase